MAFDYELLTIGAGSGGVAATRRAGNYGIRAAICEEDRVGVTCVLRGCIPKKQQAAPQMHQRNAS